MSSAIWLGSPVQALQALYGQLQGYGATWESNDALRARCVAHGGSNATTMRISIADDRLLACCHAGCEYPRLPQAIESLTGVRLTPGVEMTTMDYTRPAPQPAPKALGNLLPAPNSDRLPALVQELADYHGWVLDTPPLTHVYHDADGQPVMGVGRYAVGGGKEIRRFSWDGRRWVPRGAANVSIPLYRLPELLARPDATVLVVEGEKAADAGATLIEDCVVIAPCGGSNPAPGTDWTQLEGRQILVLGDNDDAGVKFALKVQARVGGTILNPQAVYETIGGVGDCPPKWDLADGAPPVREPEPEPEPEPELPSGCEVEPEYGICAVCGGVTDSEYGCLDCRDTIVRDIRQMLGNPQVIDEDWDEVKQPLDCGGCGAVGFIHPDYADGRCVACRMVGRAARLQLMEVA